MRVLIVEDEALIAMSIVAELQQSRHEVIGVATSFAEALALTSSKLPNIALVDIDLQRPAEGIEVARVLKAVHGVPTIFVSGQVEVARAHSNLALGVVSKPFHCEDIPLLLNVIERWSAGCSVDALKPTAAVELFRETKINAYGAVRDATFQ
jgi:DNA-binding response OmpR family regulator